MTPCLEEKGLNSSLAPCGAHWNVDGPVSGLRRARGVLLSTTAMGVPEPGLWNMEWPGFEFWYHHILAVWPLASHLGSLSFHFFLYKMRSIIPTSQGIQWDIVLQVLSKYSHGFYHLCKRKIKRAGNKKPILLWLFSKTKSLHWTLSNYWWKRKAQVLSYRVSILRTGKSLRYLVRLPLFTEEEVNPERSHLPKVTQQVQGKTQDSWPQSYNIAVLGPFLEGVTWQEKRKSEQQEDENQRCSANLQTEYWNPRSPRFDWFIKSHLCIYTCGKYEWTHIGWLIKGKRGMGLYS